MSSFLLSRRLSPAPTVVSAMEDCLVSVERRRKLVARLAELARLWYCFCWTRLGGAGSCLAQLVRRDSGSLRDLEVGSPGPLMASLVASG